MKAAPALMLWRCCRGRGLGLLLHLLRRRAAAPAACLPGPARLVHQCTMLVSGLQSWSTIASSAAPTPPQRATGAAVERWASSAPLRKYAAPLACSWLAQPAFSSRCCALLNVKGKLSILLAAAAPAPTQGPLAPRQRRAATALHALSSARPRLKPACPTLSGLHGDESLQSCPAAQQLRHQWPHAAAGAAAGAWGRSRTMQQHAAWQPRLRGAPRCADQLGLHACQRVQSSRRGPQPWHQRARRGVGASG